MLTRAAVSSREMSGASECNRCKHVAVSFTPTVMVCTGWFYLNWVDQRIPQVELVPLFATVLDVRFLTFRLSKGRPRFTFFDGPPFATGLPHYGHILAGTIKVRFQRLLNFHQSRGYKFAQRVFDWCTGGSSMSTFIDVSDVIPFQV